MAPAIPMADMASSSPPDADASGHISGMPTRSSVIEGSATTIAANVPSAYLSPHGSAGSSPTKPQAQVPEPLDLLRRKFGDFDDKDVYDNVKEKCEEENALNFVVQFGVDKAKVACNLDHNDFEALMAERNIFDAGEELPVRWMYVSFTPLFFLTHVS